MGHQAFICATLSHRGGAFRQGAVRALDRGEQAYAQRTAGLLSGSAQRRVGLLLEIDSAHRWGIEQNRLLVTFTSLNLSATVQYVVPYSTL